MEEAEVFELNGVLMVRDASGDEMPLADVMSYMNPATQYDNTSAAPVYATPPRADNPTPATPQQNTFGDVGSKFGNEALETSADLFRSAGQAAPQYDYVPDVVERANDYVGKMGMGGLMGLIGGVQKGIGYGAELMPGSRQSEQRLASDLNAMFESSGITPEGKMIGAMAYSPFAPFKKQEIKQGLLRPTRAVGRNIAERLNQRGPMPTLGSNGGNILKIDNPAGDWLEGKIKWAEKDRAKAEPDTYEANLGNVSGVTGWFPETLSLDPKMLSGFKGAMGEEKFRASGPKLKDLQDKIAKEGYKPEPITIHVREDGVPFIVEGNHRVAEAAASGRQSIPVEIKYLRGSEAVDGPLNPNVLTTYANPLPAARTDAEAMAKQILELRAAGRSNEVTEALGSNGGNMFDPPSGIRGYHGSPYSFDKFDINKIGSGEGAQVYGRGLYFAEAEDVAKHYRDNISSQSLDGAKAVLQRFGGDVDAALVDRVKNMSRLEERYIQGGMDDRLYQFMKNLGHGQIEQLKYYKNQGDFTKGNMYEVNINAKADDFLDWDKAINEQPSLIQDLIKNRKNPETELSKIYDKKMAKDGTGEDIYDYLYGGYDDQITASNLLKDAGVKGVRYLDQNSRGIGTGTRNYVVFDDRLVSIVRKYGIAGAATMLGVSQADVAKAMEQGNKQQGLLSK
jgi:hypothetical protein